MGRVQNAAPPPTSPSQPLRLLCLTFSSRLAPAAALNHRVLSRPAVASDAQKGAELQRPSAGAELTPLPVA